MAPIAERRFARRISIAGDRAVKPEATMLMRRADAMVMASPIVALRAVA
jgi:hypothetical protein